MPLAVWGADIYIGEHITQHPEVVERFIQNLPRNESLMWQAWWHLQHHHDEQANACYAALSELDDPQGYRGLADSYLAGQGFAQNTDLALILYEKAGEQGLGPAQVNAAVLCADRQEWDKAEHWFQKALNNPELGGMKDELERLHQRRMGERT